MAKTNSKGRGHTPGSIYRIALENFVTFRQVEVFPGASLNLIIGPNGTGKSTFVCAIVLGLGGKTSVIGRAKTIGEYVKSGHQQATIEIELYQNEGQPNITVTRNFNCDNNTVWSIDKKPAKMKDITDLMDRLSIRVDNLCQLLPQDRVQDFAKMNPQELLKSTQIAVSGQEAVDLLAELIENKTTHRNLNGKFLQLSAQLVEQETINANMQTEINSMQERKKMEKEIVLSEKKKLWLEYEGLRNRVDEISKDRDAAQKFVKEHRVKMQPLERQIEMGKREVTKMEESKSAMTKEISILLRQIRDTKEASQSQNGNIRELEAELAAKILQQENKHRDIEQAKATLSRMQNDLNNLLQQYGDESMVKQEMIKLQQPITKTNSSIDQLKQKKVQLQYELDSKITPLVRLSENKLRSLNNVANKRLETLQSVNEHAYRAVLWLRQNEDMFQGNVYEPMLLMLNFKDPSLAKYLENTVALRDLVAFTFEDSSDMNLFLKKVRSEMGLKMVNAVCSQPSGVVYQPPIPISQLRNIGFYTYLLDTVAGPEAIIRYLCKQYSIHRIPIGNEETYNHSQNVPPQINLFFSENHRFSVRVSEYSGAKSTSTNEIRSAKLLVNTMDQETLLKVQNELEEMMELEKHGKSKIQNLNESLGKLEDSMNLLLSKRKKFNESLEQIKTISARIRMQQNKVAALENEANIDIETEKLKCRSEVAACVLQQVKSQVKVMEFFKACTNRSLNGSVLTEKLKVLRTEVIDLQRNLRVLKDGANNAEVTLENIVRQLTSMKNTAKEKLDEAKQSTGNLLPHEKGFPLAKEFTKLPNDLTTIQEHIDVLMVKINCMGNGDNQIIIDFKSREQTIIKLKKEVASLSVQCAKLAAKMTDLRDRWLPSLEDQIEKINRKFGEMFAQLGCAGEVQISKPNGDEEYDIYGISILVRFRSEEQLQVLSSHTQSGGERALSTALYLMALQQLSKVPFRCVDEVNQGMDPINERKMFQLLVTITSTTDNSQYFLLTPKLLPNLKLTPLVHVHTIQNGSKIMKYTKWNFTQFVKQANLNNSGMDVDSDDDD